MRKMENWIKINDKKPEYGTSVLVAFTTNVGTTAYTTATLYNQKVCAHSDRKCEVWYVTISGGHQLRTVTHWTPLPDAPLN
jgi:hypothetical protein